MLDQTFGQVYTKFKLHFYKQIFNRFEDREATLTTVESFCMEVIMALGEPTIAQFSHMMNLSTPNAAYKINSLVKKGYVERSRGLEDRRVVYISLSERGRKAYGHHARFHREMIESLTSDLSEDEMQTLVKALMKLNQWFRSKDGQR